jgi:LacI family transcriptional regulator
VDFEMSGGFLCARSLSPDFGCIPIHNTEVVQGWDRKGFGQWLRKYRPDAIVSPNLEIIDFIRHLGLRVPEDIGFVHLIKPAASTLTGIDHHPEHMGSVAVDLLSSILHHNETGRVEYMRRELIEPTWYPGTTVRRITASAPGRTRHRQPATLMRMYSRHRDWQKPGQDRDVIFRPKPAPAADPAVR